MNLLPLPSRGFIASFLTSLILGVTAFIFFDGHVMQVVIAVLVIPFVSLVVNLPAVKKRFDPDERELTRVLGSHETPLRHEIRRIIKAHRVNPLFGRVTVIPVPPVKGMGRRIEEVRELRFQQRGPRDSRWARLFFGPLGDPPAGKMWGTISIYVPRDEDRAPREDSSVVSVEFLLPSSEHINIIADIAIWLYNHRILPLRALRWLVVRLAVRGVKLPDAR